MIFNIFTDIVPDELQGPDGVTIREEFSCVEWSEDPSQKGP